REELTAPDIEIQRPERVNVVASWSSRKHLGDTARFDMAARLTHDDGVSVPTGGAARLWPRQTQRSAAPARICRRHREFPSPGCAKTRHPTMTRIILPAASRAALPRRRYGYRKRSPEEPRGPRPS